VAPSSMSLGHSHQLKHVSVWIFEVNASAAVPIIELAVIEAPGASGERKARAAVGATTSR
jgi:hypothetical protein